MRKLEIINMHHTKTDITTRDCHPISVGALFVVHLCNIGGGDLGSAVTATTMIGSLALGN